MIEEKDNYSQNELNLLNRFHVIFNKVKEELYLSYYVLNINYGEEEKIVDGILRTVFVLEIFDKRGLYRHTYSVNLVNLLIESIETLKFKFLESKGLKYPEDLISQNLITEQLLDAEYRKYNE